MREGEAQEGKRHPAPAALDEEHVEDVGLAREVARCRAGMLRVRLRNGVVVCGAGFGRSDREQTAEDEQHGKEAERKSLVRSRQERRVARRGGSHGRGGPVDGRHAGFGARIGALTGRYHVAGEG